MTSATIIELKLLEGELPVTQKIGILYTAERYDGTAGFSVMNGKFITQIVLNGKQ